MRAEVPLEIAVGHGRRVNTLLDNIKIGMKTAALIETLYLY